MPKLIFALSSGRSGTFYLSQLFRLNAVRCRAVHEPIWQRGNPTFFGPAIYAASHGQLDELRRLMEQKCRHIAGQDCAWYVETSHAFLKSAYLVAHEYFPELRFVRLIRDPLKVAKSQMLREALARRWHMPMLYYRGADGGSYQRWALTGHEAIFQEFSGRALSRMQWFLLEWIEIEQRAQAYLAEHGARFPCVTLRSPEELSDAERVQAMFRELGVERLSAAVVRPSRQNHTWGTPATLITPEDVAEAQALVQALPARYTSLFAAEPYRGIPAVARLFNPG